jgi:hypothetical protein
MAGWMLCWPEMKVSTKGVEARVFRGLLSFPSLTEQASSLRQCGSTSRGKSSRKSTFSGVDQRCVYQLEKDIAWWGGVSQDELRMLWAYFSMRFPSIQQPFLS